MTSKFSIDNRELLQRISSGEAVVGIDFGNLIVRELAAFRLAAMDSEPVAVTGNGLNVALSLTQMQIDWICNTCASIYNTRNDDVAQGYINEIRATLERLAAMDSEPVIVVGDDGGDALSYRRLIQSFESGTKLYRHAQPAQVVPDEKDKTVDADDHPLLWSFNEGWNACRAAMLAAAPHDTPALNSVQSVVTVPGKWIPVSERMPEVGDIVLTAMGGAVNVGEMECSAANCRFFTSVISGRELPATHWMPLPAAPQEAQGE